MRKPRRRVVTGEDESGASFVLRDTTVPFTDVRSVHWFTERTADALRDPTAQALNRMPMTPPGGATTFQIIEVPPERPEVSREVLEKFYAGVFSGSEVARGDTGRHPGMHRTSTIDYIVVLEGELTLILGRDETVLRPFDTVVQRSTEHAWTNRGAVPAVFAAVTVDLAIAGTVRPESRGLLEIAALYGLTPAETEVALALAQGARLRDIARNRSVSLNTVRTHAARLRSKLGVASQAEIARIMFLHLGVFANGSAAGRDEAKNAVP
jgi:DNA-binding CsgD family transcriptional regulator/quercetin dioxygenase-like cupin family protein